MSKVIASSTQLKVTNLENMAGGLMADYLVCLDDRCRHGVLIAKRWSRIVPKLEEGEVVIACTVKAYQKAVRAEKFDQETNYCDLEYTE